MEVRLLEIAERIRCLREILGMTAEQVAAACGIPLEEYYVLERGDADFSFSFLAKCAEALGVDLIELVSGETPKLSYYSVVRSGKGLPIKRREGLTYNHLAYLFKDKHCEPFLVVAPYDETQQSQPIELSYHEGQEFDYILKGSLKVAFENNRTEILTEGDSIYYDSKYGHGMIAIGGEECVFLAVVMK